MDKQPMWVPIIGVMLLVGGIFAVEKITKKRKR